MKLFKMLGQVFDDSPSKIVIKEKKLADLVQEYNEQFIRSQQEIKKPVQQESAVVKNQPSNQTSYSSKNKYQNNNHSNSNIFQVLFAPSGDTLFIARNNEKEYIKLYGISHADKNNYKAKQACKYINDLVLKKKVFFEQVKVNNNIEYKIFLDKEKTTSLNDLLIQNNLSFSGKLKEDYLFQQNTDIPNIQNIKPPSEKTQKEIKGRLIKSLTAPYLFDENNKSSYVVVLENNGKEENYWGIDLRRVVQEQGIQKGDYITLENIGPELVSVDVPIKENGKVVRYEKREVKRNTWKADILEKAQIQPSTKNKVETEPEKVKENKSGLANCYALLAINANSFICMHNNKKEEYQLRGINEEVLSIEKNKEIQKYFNKIISSKVVYLKMINKEEGIVDLYLTKDDKISLNETIINNYKLNELNVEKAPIVTKSENQEKLPEPAKIPPSELVQEIPIFDNIPQEENVADYGYQVNEAPDFSNYIIDINHSIEPPDDFFSGFDLPSDIPQQEEPSRNNIKASQEVPDDFFNGFDLTNDIPQQEDPVIKEVLKDVIAPQKIPDDFFNGFDLSNDIPQQEKPVTKEVLKDVIAPQTDSDDFFADFGLDDSLNKNITKPQVEKIIISTNNTKHVEASIEDMNTILKLNEEVMLEVVQPEKKKLAFGRKK